MSANTPPDERQGYLGWEERADGYYVIVSCGDEVYENGPFLIQEDVERACDKMADWLMTQFVCERLDRPAN